MDWATDSISSMPEGADSTSEVVALADQRRRDSPNPGVGGVTRVGVEIRSLIGTSVPEAT